MSIFQEFMQTVKDVASFVGCLLSCISLITVCVKPVRKLVINKIKTIAHTNELNKQDERITILENQIKITNELLQENISSTKEIRNIIFTNEKDRLRGELFNCGNRCRRGIQLTLEEFRYIQTVGNKYLNALHCNSIGEEEYNYICSYYQSGYNQNLLKNLNKNV